MPARPLYFPALIAMLCIFSMQCKSKKESSSSSQALRPAIAALVDSIAADGHIGTASTGRMPGVSPAYTRRHRLMQEATKEEFVVLSAHDNAVLWLTALEGLYRSNADTEFDALIANALHNNTQVHYLRGDISIHMPALEYLYTYILGLTLPGETLPDHITLIGSTYSPPAPWIERAAELIMDYRNMR